jgi:asparagine synthase (glutamine-hydrolysing)
MCGLVASVCPNGGVRQDAIERALARLRHRRPDARRAWVSSGGRAGLSHARLRVIDLRRGDQPIASEDGRLRIVVSGMLYDFERLRGDLECRGHRFSTCSDSEVALHLFEDLGPRAVGALRGEFALEIWNEGEQRLFVALDRFGIKPLYYTVHAGAIHLASEIKALAALGVPLR